MFFCHLFYDPVSLWNCVASEIGWQVKHVELEWIWEETALSNRGSRLALLGGHLDGHVEHKPRVIVTNPQVGIDNF